MRTHEFEIDTSGRLVTDVTEGVQAFTAEAGGDGLLHVFVPHATAGLALKQTGAGSEEDLHEVVDRLLPREDRYAHRHGAAGHGGDHLLPALISSSMTLAVDAGRVVLGTWQSIVIVDPNRDNNRRRVRLSFLQG
jgi:secondary thiamine-phosphate synthase enzyme